MSFELPISGFDLFKTTGLPETLENILQHLKLALPYDSASIMLKQAERLEIVASYGIQSNTKQLLVARLNELRHIQNVLETGTPEYIPDTRQDPRWFYIPDSELILSWIGVPLQVGGSIIGLLNIDSLNVAHFTQQQIHLAASFAAKAAIAIDNARLVTNLREMKQSLEALIDSSFDAIIAIDSDKKITIFNRRAEELLKYRAEDWVGKNVIGLHKDIKKAEEIDRLLADEQEIVGYPVDLLDSQGEIIPFLLSAKVIRDNGNILGEVGYLKDLREKQLLETRLRALIASAKSINQPQSLAEVLEQVVDHSLRAFPQAKRGSIHLFEDKSQQLNLKITNFKDYSQEAREALIFKAGEGIAGWVFVHNQALVLPDAIMDTRYKPVQHPEIHPHRAMICTPLRCREKVIGVLTLCNMTETGVFTEEHLSLVSSFADQAAIAIDNARTREESNLVLERLERSKHLSDALVMASQVLASSADIDVQLQAVEQFLHEELHAPAIVIGIYDQMENELEFLIEKEHGETFETERVSLADQGHWGLSGFVIKHNRPVIWNTYEQLVEEARDIKINLRKRGLTGECGMIYPLEVEGDVLGIISIQSDHPHAWDSLETDAFRTLTNQLALAMHSAKLFAETEKGEKRMEWAYDASRDIVSTLDPSKALEVIVDRICSVVEARYAQAILIDEYGLAEVVACSSLLSQNEFDKSGVCLDVITAQVISDGEPLYIDDIFAPKWQVNLHVQEHGAQSAACLPLKYLGQTIGAIWVYFMGRHTFSPREKEAMRLYSNMAAIAYSNARLWERFNQIWDVALRVAEKTATGKLDDTLKTIVDGTKEALTCDIVTLYTYDDDTDQFDFPPTWVGVFNAQKVVETGFVARNAAPYTILRQGTLHWADDTKKDQILGTQFAFREGVHSSAGIPLIAQEHKVGVLFVNYRSPHHFNDIELETLRLFANQAAIAIQDLRLYQAQQEEATVLEALNKAGQSVASTLNLDEILKQIALQAWLLTAYRGNQANFTFLALVDDQSYSIVASYPEKELDVIHLAMGGKTVSVKPDANQRIGITGRVVCSRLAELVPDVRVDSDYISTHTETRVQLSVPIKYGAEVVGVISVEYPEQSGLHQNNKTIQQTDEPAVKKNYIHDYKDFITIQRDLETLAAYAATAIQNARQYEHSSRQFKHLFAVYQASKTIAERIAAPYSELLKFILEQCFDKVQPARGASLVLGDIQLYDEASSGLRLECVLPEDAIVGYRVGEIRSLDPKDGPIGISGRAFTEGKSQLVGGVLQDQDYKEFSPRTRSELDVPLVVGDECLGVISLESDQLNAYDEMDQLALESLADLAAIAIENSRRYQRLKDAQAQVGAMIDLNFMGKVEGAWKHNARNLANIIITTAANITTELKRGRDIEKIREKIEEKLERITKNAKELMDVQMPPLSSEEGVESVHINQLIRDRVERLGKVRYTGVVFSLVLKLEEKATVRASSEWLRRAIDILIDNGVNAVSSLPQQIITIQTSWNNGGVEILVIDNGTGIPAEILPTLLKEPVLKKQGEKGSGLGLLQAQTILRTYGGRLEIRNSSSSGVAMAIWLPVER